MAKKSGKSTAKKTAKPQGKTAKNSSKKSVNKKNSGDDKKSKDKSKKSAKKVDKKPTNPKTSPAKDNNVDKVTNNAPVILPPVENSVENKVDNQVGANATTENTVVNEAPVVKETTVAQPVAEEKVAPEKKIVEKKVEKKVEAKKEEKKAEPAVEKPFDIYDGESIKEVLEFPVTELQTQTQLAVSRYGIDARRLPQDIVNKINDYLTDFRAFLANPNDVTKIATIMQKDQSACDAINAWIAPKREYFEAQKLKQAGGIAVTQATDNKVVVDKNNAQNIINNAPSVPSAINDPNQQQTVVNPLPFHPQAGQTGTPDSQNYNQHQFNPQIPASTYVHNVGVVSNDIGGIKLPPASGDNSNDVNRLMAEMAQKNMNPTQKPISTPINPNTNFLEEYAKTIHETIKATFQHNHWGYIPLSILTGILKNTEKSLSYEIVMGGEQSFVKVSNGQRTVETAKFSCKPD